MAQLSSGVSIRCPELVVTALDFGVLGAKLTEESLARLGTRLAEAKDAYRRGDRDQSQLRFRKAQTPCLLQSIDVHF
jgi:hypothetical protein